MSNHIDSLVANAAERGFMRARRSSRAPWRAWARLCNQRRIPDVRVLELGRTAIVEYEMLSTSLELDADGLLLVWDLFNAQDSDYQPNSTYGFTRVPVEGAEHVASELIKIIANHSRPAHQGPDPYFAAAEMAKQSDIRYLQANDWTLNEHPCGGVTARRHGGRAMAVTSAIRRQLSADVELLVGGA